MTTTFYIVRHGETEWNAEERLQGWLDSSLTEKGRFQAKQLAQQLLEVDFKVALVSTSGRAQETTRILLKNREEVNVLLKDDLREIHMGQWQGRQVSEILASDDREAYIKYSEEPGAYVAQHTESFEQVTNRAFTVLQEAAKRYENCNVLVVTHGVTVKCIVNKVLGRELDALWTPPWIEGTSITELLVDNSYWQLKKIGCTAHLQ